MAGLFPAIHVFDSTRDLGRGYPRTSAAMTIQTSWPLAGTTSCRPASPFAAPRPPATRQVVDDAAISTNR